MSENAYNQSMKMNRQTLRSENIVNKKGVELFDLMVQGMTAIVRYSDDIRATKFEFLDSISCRKTVGNIMRAR